ncbi:hypothetical protein [Paenibacillus contaminans]|uniref:Uncharacterized protein n=1 Tax=Paenibacillus contaminans TaxID=450362 RepID=A0A329MRV7_9BACL|nr:hypothetical protein [Paenibacillus contaminans]RAV22524.1 hypothetical protein DQG23_06200 [Paenibacillus contaminans]
MHDHPSKRLIKSHGTTSRMQTEKDVQQRGNEQSLQRALGYGHPLTSAHILQLQRSVGNAAAAQLVKSQRSYAPQDSEGGALQRKIAAASHAVPPVQRAESEEEREGEEAEQEADSMAPGGTDAMSPEEAYAPEGADSLTPEEADTFETVMSELSDEELETALDAEFAEGETPEEEAPAQMKPESAGSAVVQMARTTLSISSEKSPNLPFASKLEKNKSKKPRLVPKKRWHQIRDKHKKRGFRKYAAILHQNLQDDLGKQDLVLLLRVRRKIKIGDALDLHYSEIEKKAAKKRQTAQTRTELLGEAVTTIRMEGYAGGDCELIIGYASGAGIDQLWRSPSKKTYYVVEAKGPGAKLKADPFAVRGAANGSTLVQMSQEWIEDRIPRLKTSYPTQLQKLLDDCGLKVNQGKLEKDAAKNATYGLEGLVITAKWDEAGADIGSGMSKRNYTF